ncbi:hypothetical protein FVP77_00095 [Microbacterium hatanonis]|uniref:Uncharacterized protein n=1 Tax=Microbacterium hatanonis TaxID=404366 RepID=A0A5C8I1J6_9MICO|nr:hypothetical protein FVP77_00095 [Microbacterium hatanonis]
MHDPVVARDGERAAVRLVAPQRRRRQVAALIAGDGRLDLVGGAGADARSLHGVGAAVGHRVLRDRARAGDPVRADHELRAGHLALGHLGNDEGRGLRGGWGRRRGCGRGSGRGLGIRLRRAARRARAQQERNREQ